MGRKPTYGETMEGKVGLSAPLLLLKLRQEAELLNVGDGIDLLPPGSKGRWTVAGVVRTDLMRLYRIQDGAA